jgi:hypothetical protein
MIFVAASEFNEQLNAVSQHIVGFFEQQPTYWHLPSSLGTMPLPWQLLS